MKVQFFKGQGQESAKYLQKTHLIWDSLYINKCYNSMMKDKQLNPKWAKIRHTLLQR